MNRKAKQEQAGFTLIEIMIAVAITGIVIASLTTVFTGQQRTYQQQSELVRNQASIRASLAMIGREIRMAGYTGIAAGLEKVNDPDTGSGVGAAFPIIGLRDGNTAITSTLPLVQTSVNNILPPLTGLCVASNCKSDVIEIWGNFSRGIGELRSELPEGTISTVTIPKNDMVLFGGLGSNFSSPAFVLVGSHKKLELLQFASVAAAGNTVANITVGTGSTPPRNALIQRYFPSDGAEPENRVVPLFRRVYYIDETFVLPGETLLTPSLFMGNYNAQGQVVGGAVELANGIESFQITYDVVDGQRLTVVNLPADPCLVRAVHITIQTTGWHDPRRPRTETMNDLRREMTTTVRIRNLGLATSDSCPLSP